MGKRKTAVTLAASALALAGLVSAAPAAEATTCYPIVGCDGGDVKHGPDDGYDQPIYVLCNYSDGFAGPNETQPRSWAYMNARAKFVAEGTNSEADCGIDTDIIVVRDNEEVWCKVGMDPIYQKMFDATGPHKINDLFKETCVLHRD